ncbi:DUF4961 domain-containing protein [Mucilaginibacter pallidiroseus]|uniref:DUF4961 domain-containing protein n=1 Tax=Mucilaginibacter pallidiroseus TaxID=2599295 RepID=A0A563TZM0_9SPHI|nr:DUF4961 domain-containing protein [Mucilaginibacter pallidiroseus]TWR24816.1 DUF4961 domain-containing protein [Mucilaginibacter pallidiroseus]
MKKSLQNTRKKLIRYVTLFMFILLLSNCEFVINSIVQPKTANAGDQITATLDANFRVDGAQTNRIIVGILAPKSWKLGQNTTISYTSIKGNGVLTLIPASEVAASAKNGENWATRMRNKLGIGPNYIDDMEWVPFRTTTSLTAVGEDVKAVFTIKMKVGVDGLNTSVKLGYIVCNNTDGLDDGSPNLWPVKYADCLEVAGTGDLIDYCNPALSVINPVKSLDNDYQSISFDNTIIKTALQGEQDIYICATAHTSDGKNITVCGREDRSRLQQTATNKFSITLWPRGYFKVDASQTITSIDYTFTDETGAKIVGVGNTEVPFVLKFNCN